MPFTARGDYDSMRISKMLKLPCSFGRLGMHLRLDGRSRVGFLIAGVQKGGTTALDAYLRDHPQICMASRKEVHFFDNEELFRGGKPDYDLYHSFFKPGKSHKILGEATTAYIYWKPAFGRIRQYNPRMKIIIILRNPIERAYSHWNMQRILGKESLSFREAIQVERQRIVEAQPWQNRMHSYMDKGFYADQLKRLWSYFPECQTLIVTNEDLRMNPRETLDKVCNFLGVSRFRNVEPKDVFPGAYDSAMTNEERKYLRTVFGAEIRKLEQILGLDLSKWR